MDDPSLLKFEPKNKRFDTAIFYDVENLVGGYGDPDVSVSLKRILATIKEKANIGEISVQRAYANWSDRRFIRIKREINELGIEPIQVIGFSRFAKKNAADIQLVVDAIDIAYIRPAIKKFVVISGDGGFAALANKLHEYGKTVIGCAYEDSTNLVFKSVCDDFVTIEVQRDEEEQTTPSKPTPTHRIAKAMIETVPKLMNYEEISKVEEHCKKMIKCLTDDPEIAKDVKINGVSAKVIHEAFMFSISDFPAQYKTIGFTKYNNFLRYIFKDTGLYLFRYAGDFKVATRNTQLVNYKRMDYIDKHSTENYRDILGNNKPMFKLPNSDEELYKIVEYLVKMAEELPLKASEIIEEIGNLSSEEDEESFSMGTIKNTVYSLSAANIFIKHPPDAKFSEQTLKLDERFYSQGLIVEQLQQEVNKTLKNFLGEVEEKVIEKIIS